MVDPSVQKWKDQMAELKRHWNAWVTLNKPFFEESNRRCRAFGIGVIKGESGRDEALQANAPGNADTKGEAAAFALGAAAGPVLRAKLWQLALEALSGKKIPAWVAEILKAMLESVIPK